MFIFLTGILMCFLMLASMLLGAAASDGIEHVLWWVVVFGCWILVCLCCYGFYTAGVQSCVSG